MRKSSTLLLLLLTLALAGWVFLHERRQPSRTVSGLLFDLEGNPVQDQSITLEVDASTVKGIDLKSPAGELALRDQKDGTWDIIRSIKDRANPEKIQTLIDFINTARVLDTLPAHELEDGTVKAADIGLDDAGAIHLTYRKDGGNRITELLIGRTAPLGNAMYVMMPGEDRRPDVYIVHPDLRELLARPMDDFRDPSLTKYPAEDVERFSIRHGEGEIEFGRRIQAGVSAAWFITRPLPNARAAQNVVNDLLGMLNEARIESFIPGAPAAAPAPGVLAAEKPLAEITFVSARDAAKKGVTLQFFPDGDAPDTKTALCRDRDRKAEFKVSRELVDDIMLAQNPNTFRDPNLADLNKDAIDFIETVLPGADSVQLMRVGERWSVRHSGGGALQEASAERIESLIRQINGTEILEYASDSLTDPALFGFDKPLASVIFGATRLQDPSNPPALTPKNSRTLRLGAVADGQSYKVYANFTGEPFVYRVGAEVPGYIPRDIIRWRTLQLPGFALTQLRSITRSVGTEPAVRLSFTPLNFSWTAERDGTDITPLLIKGAPDALATQLGSLQAVSWQLPSAATETAFASPVLSVTVAFDAPGQAPGTQEATRITYDFAAINGDIRAPFFFGRHSGLPGVFLIETQVLKKLGLPLVQAPAP